MPLKLGTSPQVRSQNIGELVRNGYKPKQAEAIAYNVQRKAQDKKAAVKKGK